MLPRALSISFFIFSAIAAVDAFGEPAGQLQSYATQNPAADLTQSQAQSQAAQNYIDMTNSSFARSAETIAIGLMGMKASCGTSIPAPASVAPASSVTGPSSTSHPTTKSGDSPVDAGSPSDSGATGVGDAGDGSSGDGGSGGDGGGGDGGGGE